MIFNASFWWKNLNWSNKATVYYNHQFFILVCLIRKFEHSFSVKSFVFLLTDWPRPALRLGADIKHWNHCFDSVLFFQLLNKNDLGMYCSALWTLLCRYLKGKKLTNLHLNLYYRTRTTITRSWSVTALVYKLRILGLKNEEFPFLVHKWSVM